MSWLSPLWLVVGAAGALATVALHFITTSRAPAVLLPTARFVPRGEASAVARSRRPADLVLLAVRVLAVMLLAAAFAQPVVHTRGGGVRRVLVADRSRGAGTELRERVRGEWRTGDALVLLDSTARVVTVGAEDTISKMVPTLVPGLLSAGVIAARRAASVLAQHADSVELVVISPLTADEFDSATSPLLRAWPGRVRVVRVAASPTYWPTVSVAGGVMDAPLAATAVLISRAAPPAVQRTTVRVTRLSFTAADSAAARDGAALVHWEQFPASASIPAKIPASSANALPASTPSPAGLTDNRATVVATFGRVPIDTAGTVIARWADGAPAAVEQSLGQGCLRHVGVALPSAGDAAIQPAFVALSHTLLGPCIARSAWPAISDSLFATLQQGGPAARASALLTGHDESPLAPWLLAAALVALLAEYGLRAGVRS